MGGDESGKKLSEVIELLRREYPEILQWMEERGLTKPWCLLDHQSIIDILIDILSNIVFRDTVEELQYEVEMLEIERDGERIKIPIIHTWLATLGEDKVIIQLPDKTVGLAF